MKKIFETITEQYAMLKSVTFELLDETTIKIYCVKYRQGENSCTPKQYDFIQSLDNVTSPSNSTIRKMNKWAASALITLANKYPSINFVVGSK